MKTLLAPSTEVVVVDPVVRTLGFRHFLLVPKHPTHQVLQFPFDYVPCTSGTVGEIFAEILRDCLRNTMANAAKDSSSVTWSPCVNPEGK